VLSLVLASASFLEAQYLYDGNNNLPPFGGFSGGDFDTVALQNGNLHLHIPLGSWKQRGGRTVSLFFTYDTPTWIRQTTITTINGQRWQITSYVDPSFQQPAYWRFVNSATAWGVYAPPGFQTTCAGSNNPTILKNQYALVDSEGTKHPTNLETDSAGCFAAITQAPAMDGIGALGNVNGTVTLKDGTISASGNLEDTNGNLMGSTDTLNRTLVTTANGTGYTTYTITDPNGVAQIFRVDYTTMSTATNYCGNLNNPNLHWSCNEATANLQVPSKLTLPDGQTYQFAWFQNTPGELQSMILPTGATITYSYSTPACTHGPPGLGQSTTTVPYDCKAHVATRTVTVNGVNSVWSYSGGTVTDPLGNQQVHTFSSVTAGGETSSGTVETQVQYYDGSATSGKLLKTVATAYTGEANLFTGFVANVRPISVTTTLDDGEVTQIQTDYETFTFGSGPVYTATRMNPTEKREYAFGNGAPGALLRKTDYTYLHNSNSAYLNLNIVDRPASIITYDGSSNPVAQTTYEYDVYNHSGLPTMGSSGAVQHDAARGTSYTTRGNPTGVSKWVNTTSSWLTTNNQFDDAGNIIATKDPRGNVTNFDYTDSWVSIAGTTGGSACAPSGQGKAYLTKITNALNQVTTSSYYSCTGALGSTTDPNNLTTWYVYDMFNRAVQAHKPDGGVITSCFTDTGGTGCTQSSPPFQVVITKPINATTNGTTTSITDGLGRVTQVQLNTDPQGVVYTDTTYDLNGRVASVSNPYRSGSDPTSSQGTTTYAYDGLDRKKTTTYPDTSVLTTAYCGPSTLVTDPTGKWRRSRTDALGRLIEVDEPNAVGATVASTGCPGTSEPIWVTSYTVDTLGNLKQVVQNGSRQRNFTYDSLSRLLTASNPENGTVTYAYDSNTSCASPNSFAGLLVSKTDARGIRTCAQYDVVNRQTVINYSNGDPTITTTYDQTACLGLPSCQNIGQKTSMTDAAGSEAWSYQIDATNKRTVHVNQRTNTSSPSNLTKTSTYYLDLAGNLTSVVYPTGRTVNYTYDSADRPVTAVDSANGITYASAPATPLSGCLAGSVCYTPQGTVYSMSIGKTSSFTGLNFSESFNNRLQPNEIKASSTGGNAMDITYNFVDPVTTKNAGHVYGITNNLDNTRSQTFTYDQLNRIATAQTTSTFSTSPSHCWGEIYTVDAWGNLQTIAATTNSSYTGCTQESGFTKTPDANNHLSGLAYDLAGNTTNDGFVTNYVWDGESQLKSAAGVSYTYDGSGRRVSKSNGKYYWYGSGGEILAETNASGTTTAEYIFFGGKRIAMLPAGGNAQFYVEDLLGTSRVVTTNTGAVCYDADFYPYGGERPPYTNTCTQNAYKFEGKERDTETGNDEFGARYYSNRFGRWLSADWSDVPAPVPYAKLTNPQTLNLYAMVADDPESFADLDGHCGTPNDPCRTQMPPNNPCSGSGDNCNPSAQQQNQQPCFNCRGVEVGTWNGQAVVAATSQTQTVTYDADNHTTTTTTVTTTAYFSQEAGHEGQFLGAYQNTATSTVQGPNLVTGSSTVVASTSSTVSLGVAAASTAIGSPRFNTAQKLAASPDRVAYFLRQSKQDVIRHPFKYLFKAGEVGLLFIPVAQEAEGFKMSAELHAAVVELINDLGDK
jgi:RHS repeat-associated protein